MFKILPLDSKAKIHQIITCPIFPTEPAIPVVSDQEILVTNFTQHIFEVLGYGLRQSVIRQIYMLNYICL